MKRCRQSNMILTVHILYIFKQGFFFFPKSNIYREKNGEEIQILEEIENSVNVISIKNLNKLCSHQNKMEQNTQFNDSKC